MSVDHQINKNTVTWKHVQQIFGVTRAQETMEAIRADGTTKRLFLIENDKAVEMVVQTGSTKDGRIAVLEKLAPKAKVIVKPPEGLRDGSAILQ